MHDGSIKLYSLKQDIDENIIEISKILSLGIIDSLDTTPIDSLYLLYDSDGLSLHYNNLSIKADFTENKKRFNKNNLFSEMIVKSAKIKNINHIPTVIDATAGLGEDSILLAAAGYKVYMYEYNTVIYSLLYDALYRAKKDEFFSEIIPRITTINGDSINDMKKLDFVPDIIYLDPMFPTRVKSSLIKKKFQLLQKLELPCSNGNDLLNAALSTGAKKIIIKRPLKGDILGNIKPNYSHYGKSIRYDCILNDKKEY